MLTGAQLFTTSLRPTRGEIVLSLAAVVAFIVATWAFSLSGKTLIAAPGVALLVLVLMNVRLPIAAAFAAIVIVGLGVVAGTTSFAMLASGAAVVGVYAGGVWALERLRAWRSGPVTESVSFVILLGGLAPIVSGVAVAMADGGRALANPIVVDTALRQAVATLVIVPLVVSIVRREHDELSWSA